MDKCKIFCGLYETWQKEGQLIYEDDHTAAIFSVTPVYPGQPIIFPRKHVTTLSELRGAAAESFLHAPEKVFAALQNIYDAEVERVVAFYESLATNPPFEAAGNYARMMLNHPDLNVRPTGYNIGMNKGSNAGQLEGHLHWHLHLARAPRPGVNTAFRSLEETLK